MSTKKEYINKEEINYKILLELEEKIKNKISLTKEEINYFLTCLVIITRTKIINKNGKLENGCDLAQSMICHYLEELNIKNYPNMTLSSICEEITGHSFVVATFNVEDKEIDFLIDPTYIQFFYKEDCTDKSYIIIERNNREIIIKTPPPGYFIKKEDMEIINKFNSYGFEQLSERLAQIYGDSFYNTKALKFDKTFQSIPGSIYINSFLKRNVALSNTKEELETKQCDINFRKEMQKELNSKKIK